MTTKIDELKALMAAATPGPWRSDKYGVRDIGGYICELHWPHRYEGQEERYTQELAERESDARLIAEIPNALPALIAAVEALKAIVELDDGDKPDLWHFAAEFDAARAALKPFGE